MEKLDADDAQRVVVVMHTFYKLEQARINFLIQG